jgi:Protein of unknown function (DUF3147)
LLNVLLDSAGSYIDASCGEVVPTEPYSPIPMSRAALQVARLRRWTTLRALDDRASCRRKAFQLIWLGQAMDYVIRFLAGGVLVSLFAVAGDVLRPKSFAGLFGAAPSVALATLTLAFWKHGGGYVSTEGRSMIIGAVALAVYSFLVCQLLMRLRYSALTATAVAIVAWLVIAVGLKQAVLG